MPVSAAVSAIQFTDLSCVLYTLAYLEGMLSLVWSVFIKWEDFFLKNIAFHQSPEASIHQLISSQLIFEQRHIIKEFSFCQLHREVKGGE